jgi:hypothetical protein
MLAHEKTTAVCVIKIEPQSSGALIKVTVHRDITARSAPRVRHFTDIATATSVVAAFLKSVIEDYRTG